MKDYLEKRREELRKQGGFTLMEMLIVVAIIAVLVAIAIPIFTAQLEKSREATDAANIRGAYAEVVAEALTQSGTPAEVIRTVNLKQAQEGWQGETPNFAGEGVVSGGAHVDPTTTGTPKASGTCTVTYTPASGSSENPTVTIAFSS